MATHTYDIIPQAAEVSVTQSAGGTVGASAGMRIIVDDAVCLSRTEFEREVNAIFQRVYKDTWPPSI